MSEKLFQHAVREWLEDGSDRTPRPAIDAVLLAVKTTPQERDLRIPWRFNLMPVYLRLGAAIAVVAIVAVGIVAFNSRSSGVGSQTPAPTVTAAPPASAAPASVAPGISAWKTYTSAIYPITFSYPADWKVEAPATRAWQAGDTVLDADRSQFADVFTAPDADTIGLFVWEMPAGENADVESVDGLKAWAKTFCDDVGLSACEGFTAGADTMCLNAGGDACRGAILVRTDEGQFAFFASWNSAILTSAPDRVRVVEIAREDAFPSAARYGGSVALLKSILTQMDVWTPGTVPPAT